MQTAPEIRPPLDPGFVPAAVWNRRYMERVDASDAPSDVVIGLLRPDDTGSTFHTRVLPPSPEHDPLTLRYLERLLKFLLWQRGAQRILIGGCDAITGQLASIYSVDGARRFDSDFIGRKVYGKPLEIVACRPDEIPDPGESASSAGRHLDGCRIGFDLGGSDRKCAAVQDGAVVFSEEVEWSPYFESNPEYHIDGIQNSLERAAAHLPRVDAIGGSAAGIYVNSEPRAASLFRGVSDADFEATVRPLFHHLQARWNGVPFVVVNDGEVTALAGSMDMDENAVLGIAMGTSEAVGYVDANGSITPWLNELAFAPVDYRDDAPADEWSGDAGCGAQYFSQQAVARLIPAAGIEVEDDMPLPKRLAHVQQLMADGDPRAAKIYETIGVYFGYGLAWYAEFYDIGRLLLLGRVTSGAGGDVIIREAEAVLRAEFPELAEKIQISMPDETMKRHGQAIAAASLPALDAVEADHETE